MLQQVGDGDGIYDITRGNHCGIIPTSVKIQHMV